MNGMRGVFLSLLAFGCTATGLAAQTITSPYRYVEEKQSISLLAGYLSTDRGDLDLAPGSAPMLGLEYAGRLSGPVYGLLGVSFLPGERSVRIFDPSNASAFIEIGDTPSRTILAEAGFRFHVTGPRTWHDLSPFLGATVGVVADLTDSTPDGLNEPVPDDQAVRLGPSFAVGASAGTDWFLTERISLRGVGRGYLWRFTTPEGFDGVKHSDWLRNFGGTIGVAFHF